MAGKSVGLPTGVELRNGVLRIRFSWNGKRCSETVPFPPTQAGITSAARLRNQVVNLIKHRLLDEAKPTKTVVCETDSTKLFALGDVSSRVSSHQRHPRRSAGLHVHAAHPNGRAVMAVWCAMGQLTYAW